MTQIDTPFAKFYWLLSPSMLPPQKQCPEKDLDEACLFVKRHCWHILPGVMPIFLSWIGDCARETSNVKQLEQEAYALREYARIQNNFVSQIASAFDRNKIPYSFLKSSALRWTVYNNPLERLGADLDIAVSADWLEKCKLVVKTIGFEPAQWNRVQKKYERANPFTRRASESRSYELGFFVYRLKLEEISIEAEMAIRSSMHEYPELWFSLPNGDIGCYQVLDIHHGINHERNISVEPLIDSHHVVEVRGINYSIPRPSWLLLHLVCKIYFERVHKQSISYQYADVCRLVSKMSSEEYKHFRSLLIEYDLETEAYFVLHRLQSNFEIKLSSELCC